MDDARISDISTDKICKLTASGPVLEALAVLEELVAAPKAEVVAVSTKQPQTALTMSSASLGS